MSHFCVYVVGDDVGEQLAPYHEFECTGLDDQYVQDIDKTEKARQTYQRSGLDTPLREDEELPENVSHEAWWISQYFGAGILHPGEARTEAHKYGFVEVDEQGEVLRFVDRTNPNAKWDWWVVGGRWSNSLKTKFGYASEALRKDISFALAREIRYREACAEFDAWTALVAKHGEPPLFTALLAEMPVQEARKQYHSHPIWVAMRDSGVDALAHFWGCPVTFFGKDREAFAYRQALYEITPYAVVKDGKWLARGEMGWFGVSHDDVEDRLAWSESVVKMLEELPPDTRITVVDCHI